MNPPAGAACRGISGALVFEMIDALPEPDRRFSGCIQPYRHPYIGLIRKRKGTAIERIYRQIMRDGDIALNVGSSTLTYGKNCINLDICPFSGVDVLGDAHDLPFRSEAFRLCILSAVLQYCSSPTRVAEEIFRVLAPGGIAVIDAPFMQPECGRHDLHRFSKEGLIECFKKMEVVDCKTSISFGSALAFYIQNAVLVSISNRYIRFVVTSLVSALLLPLSLMKLTAEKNVAGAFMLIARKPIS
jgi:SAM-dependent methyltransferase